MKRGFEPIIIQKKLQPLKNFTSNLVLSNGSKNVENGTQMALK